MQDYSKAKVGDKVWWSDINNRKLGKGIIAKVGSKLLTVNPVWGDDERVSDNTIVFRKDSGCTNDDYGHQTLIVDLAAHEDSVKAHKIAFQLREQLQWKRDLTTAQLIEAAKILNIDVDY